MARRGKMSTTKAQDDIELYNKLLSHFENQFERTNYWLSFAEAKNGAIIAINVALIAVLITIFDKAPIFCIVAVIFFLISCSISLISFIPNIKGRPVRNKNAKKKIKPNLLFFKDIADIETADKYIELTINRYFDVKGKTLVDDLVNDLASEILMNSRIALKKYDCFKIALKFDFVALILTVIFLCVA